MTISLMNIEIGKYTYWRLLMVARSILFTLFFLFSAPLLIHADFYKFKDESGGLSITNDYNSIPERYRTSVIVVKDADLEKKSQAREKLIRADRNSREQRRQHNTTNIQLQTAPVSTSSVTMPNNEKDEIASENAMPPKRLNWIERQVPLLKVAALITMFVAFAVVAGKLISSLVPRLLGVVIRIALFVGVVVYIFNAYSEKVAGAFAVLKSEKDVVQKAVDKRSEMIEKQSTEH